MADTQFLRLSKKWALAFDKNQWIVQRRKAPRKKGGASRWEGVAFIAESKDIFSRVFEEKGIDLMPVARAYIDAMPDTFREWISIPPARRFTVGHSAIPGVVVGRTAPAPERNRDRAKNAA